MEKTLPIINIEGTEFIVDVRNEELRQEAYPQNTMNIKDMLYVGTGYQFHYDTGTKNLASFEAASGFTENENVKKIRISNLTELDPAGMANRYSKPIDYVKSKTDFELTITPGSLMDLRWNKRILPTLEIAGHPFFVDTAMDKLRPKDDFISNGINLEQIRDYYDRIVHAYIIPYNPSTHEFQEVDHLTIAELPKEIIIVKFPHHQELDRV